MGWGDLGDLMKAKPNQKFVLLPGSLISCGQVHSDRQFSLWDNPDPLSDVKTVPPGPGIVLSVDSTSDAAGVWYYILIAAQTGWIRNYMVMAP